jgi:hypothetical protein
MTQQAKHTPGPWHYGGEDEFPNEVFSYDRHATPLAECRYGSHDPRGYDDEDVANARLIRAAPDLLKALQDLFACGMERMLMGDGRDDQIAAIAAARAAISRATGESA